MSKNAGNIVLEAKNVVYYYKANKGKKVLDDISYGFEIGKMYAILGPSGSGKTTFLSLLAGLDSPTDGGIYYEGVNIRKKGLHNYRKKNMSLVFQNYNLIDYLTPEENVMLVLRLGPFCHGEVYQGGIPSWVHEKAGQNPKYKIRARTPGFLEDCTELYNTIFAQVNGLLWKDGGPVVGVQIENESRGPWDYLEALKNIAVKAGFDVPFYTRTGWPALRGKEIFGQLLPLYGDYADGNWRICRAVMPMLSL